MPTHVETDLIAAAAYVDKVCPPPKPPKPGDLKLADLVVGHVYSAKRPQRAGLFNPRLNDRQILWIDSIGDTLQYDSPTVGHGRHYPKVKVEAFLRWAKADVTELCPKDEWRMVSAV